MEKLKVIFLKASKNSGNVNNYFHAFLAEDFYTTMCSIKPQGVR